MPEYRDSKGYGITNAPININAVAAPVLVVGQKYRIQHTGSVETIELMFLMEKASDDAPDPVLDIQNAHPLRFGEYETVRIGEKGWWLWTSDARIRLNATVSDAE